MIPRLENIKELKQDDSDKDNTVDGFSYCYGQLKHQQIMLEDKVRVHAYRQAIMKNKNDFRGKVIMDVGAGTGILSFFSIQAGAKKVYAIEASNMAKYAKQLMESNNHEETKKCEVIHSKVEDVKHLGDKVDVIMSEPIGFCLVHERMLESFITARDLCLRLNPASTLRMFPSSGTIHVAPFNDYDLHYSQLSKAEFWTQKICQYDLSCLHEASIDQYFSQAFMGSINPRTIVSHNESKITFDFMSVTKPELQDFHIDLTFFVTETTIIHGLACWFSIDLSGSSQTVILSTDPNLDPTHWYQTRFLFKEPIAVNNGQSLSGLMHFSANEHHSYNIQMKLKVDGTNKPEVFTENNRIWLHEQQW